MSGHSKWSTIKRKKQANDKARGKLFSKLSKAISIAVKTGGSNDPEMNPKLRVAIEAAKEANMPKENIKRALSRGESSAENLEEVVYEGFGPGGASVIVDVATDNRNRSSQEIKRIFDKSGGNLAGPGAVAYNFQVKGLIIIKKADDYEEIILNLIEKGIQNYQESGEVVEVFTDPKRLIEIKEEFEKAGIEVENAEMIKKPKREKEINNEKSVRKLIGLIDKLDEHDDVQKVYTDADIDDKFVS